MTCSLQPVEAAIGRSFLAVFRRLLVNHVPRYAERVHSHERPGFKLTKAITICDGVRLMSEAWDFVAKSFVFNG